MEFSAVVGIIGAGIVIVCYLLLQMEILNSRDLSYSAWNSFASMLLMYSLSQQWNLPSFVIEVFWLAISLYGVIKHFKNKNFTKNRSVA